MALQLRPCQRFFMPMSKCPEKAGRTVYFWHQSTQEFLASEHLFNTALLTQDDSSNDPVGEVCSFASHEVAQFLSESFESRPDAQEKAILCCDALRDYKKDLTIESLRPFTKAYSIYQKHQSTESPWLFLLDFHAKFPSPRSPGRFQFLLKVIKDKHCGRNVWLIAVQQACLEEQTSIGDNFIDLFCAVLESSNLLHFIDKANQTRMPVDVDTKEFAPYCVLKSMKVEVSDEMPVSNIKRNIGKIIVSYEELKGTARKLLGFGPLESGGTVLLNYPVEPLEIYSRLGWSGQKLKKLRILINDPQIRRHIRPLEIIQRRASRK